MELKLAAAAGVGLAAVYLLRRRLYAPAASEPATLYCFPPTTCSRRVLMCLAELGCEEGRDYVIKSVSTTGPNKTPEYMARQPFGKIPAWREGEWVLFESLAICEYLCTRFAGRAASRLLPPPGRARAEVHKWVSVEATELRPNILKPYKERVLKPMKGLGESDESNGSGVSGCVGRVA